MSTDNIIDITDALRKETPVRSKARKGAYGTILIAGSLLLVDDLVKRFSSKKRVKVSVADVPQTDES